MRARGEGLAQSPGQEDSGGPDPDPGHGGQDRVKRVGLHQSLDLGGDIRSLGVQGDELARQVRQDDTGRVGPRDGDGLLAQGIDNRLRPQGVALGAVGLEPWSEWFFSDRGDPVFWWRDRMGLCRE